MNIDPKWLTDYARRAGIVGPWTQHGDVWLRRWVRLPAEDAADHVVEVSELDAPGVQAAVAQAAPVAAVVYPEDDEWGFVTSMDADSADRWETAKAAADHTLHGSPVRLLTYEWGTDPLEALCPTTR